MGTKQRDTDSDWKLIAETQPFWGVLSQEEFRGNALDAEKLGRFMESGEQFIRNLFGLIRKHLVDQFAPKRALDFGCGVGRLLIPLARRTQEAVGVDIAPVMLDLCRKHADEAGVKNIDLHVSDDHLSNVGGEFDLVNTHIVLQHIPPERGYRIIQAMIDKLAVGGVGSIQVTYAKAMAYLAHEQSRALYYRRDGGTIVTLVESGWSPPEGTITMYDYDLNEVFALVSRCAGRPMITLPTSDDNHLGLHIVFVKARK